MAGLNFLGQAANGIAITVQILYLVHNGFNEANAKAAFSFLMNQIVQIGCLKLVDVKNIPFVNNFKNDVLTVAPRDANTERIIGIAVVRMNHQIGAHLVQRENDLALGDLVNTLLIQRLSNKVADTLQVMEAATGIKLIAHPQAAWLHPWSAGYSEDRPIPK